MKKQLGTFILLEMYVPFYIWENLKTLMEESLKDGKRPVTWSQGIGEKLASVVILIRETGATPVWITIPYN